jgi:Protein of unknown function (DUF3616)
MNKLTKLALVSASMFWLVPLHAQPRYFGMCDASAAVDLGNGQFVVADDETPDLFIFKREGPLVHRIPLAVALGNVKQKDDGSSKAEESDTEGAAQIGDRIYWISSHGLKGKADKVTQKVNYKAAPYRLRFFATQLTPQDETMPLRLVGRVRTDLREVLAQHPPSDLPSQALGKGPEEEGGFNIEGLSAGPRGSLFIGLRNPLDHGQALVLPLLNPQQVIDDGAPFNLGKVIPLDLGGRGIRSIEKVGRNWLIVGGPIGDLTETTPKPYFELFSWTGERGDKPKPIQDIIAPGFRPEALFYDRQRKELVMLSDDGDELVVDDEKCKDSKDDAAKSFKSMTRPWPEPSAGKKGKSQAAHPG